MGSGNKSFYLNLLIKYYTYWAQSLEIGLICYENGGNNL
jgi:hypothetical protein